MYRCKSTSHSGINTGRSCQNTKQEIHFSHFLQNRFDPHCDRQDPEPPVHSFSAAALECGHYCHQKECKLSHAPQTLFPAVGPIVSLDLQDLLTAPAMPGLSGIRPRFSVFCMLSITAVIGGCGQLRQILFRRSFSRSCLRHICYPLKCRQYFRHALVTFRTAVAAHFPQNRCHRF